MPANFSAWTRMTKMSTDQAPLCQTSCQTFITSQRNGQRFPLLIPILFLPILLHFPFFNLPVIFCQPCSSVRLLHVSLFNGSSISLWSALHSNSSLQPCKWDPVSVGASGSGSDTCQSPWWQAACFSHLYQITCIVLRELQQWSAEGWESQGPSEEMSRKEIHDPLRMNSPGFSDAASQSWTHVDSSSFFSTSRPVQQCKYCKCLQCATLTCWWLLRKSIHTYTDIHCIEK